ncbi:MAG TPA: hypothetical protein VFP67_03585 [Acidimicrobiia bacterium]|nr:hypothetical protein [Acidimicrobiia bacterium]
MDTFVVRVWGPMADGEEETSLRGVVEHIASGRSDRFRTTEELVSFLRVPPGPAVEAEGLSDDSGIVG